MNGLISDVIFNILSYVRLGEDYQLAVFKTERSLLAIQLQVLQLVHEKYLQKSQSKKNMKYPRGKEYHSQVNLLMVNFATAHCLGTLGNLN